MFSPASLLWPVALLLAGLLNTFAFAPYNWHALPLLTVLLLAVAITKASGKRQAFWYGWCYGIGWFGLGISWVHVSIATFGGMPLLASLSIMAALVAYLALFPGLAALLSWWLSQRKPWLLPVLLAASWTIAENLRSWVFTGFPWLSLGYSQTDGWLSPYAPLIGETGITFLLVFTAAVFVHVVAALRQNKLAPPLSAFNLQLLIAVLLYASAPLWTGVRGWQLTGDSQQVALVQGNIQQELRWVPEQELPTMKKYMALSRDHMQDTLMIWPEAAVPQIEPLAQAYLINLDILALEKNAAVITGILDYKRNGDAYNGIIVLGKQDDSTASYHYKTSNRYQKHQLLPIGEFVPFESWLRDVAPFFDLPNSSFARGQWRQPNLIAKQQQLLPALCFEIAFPRQIAANFAADTDFLLTISNDAWFGDSIGPWQHLEIARMRALEFGRPLLRATNNGITAAVGADGQILGQLPQFQDGVLQLKVPQTSGMTVYSMLGDWPLYLLSLLLLSLPFWRRPGPLGTGGMPAMTERAQRSATATQAVTPVKPAAPANKPRIEPHF
jgi:apolipoprotein N-acyltransferase